ncbi:MAG: response regulator [Bacteroidetes bacterium]|nr:response regulator [Bacteroidota bacterium]
MKPFLRRILLAEDSARDVELTLEALAEYNLANEVIVVEDGVEVLDYLYCRGKYEGRIDRPPAVVLLDIKMPRMNGIEVLRAIRASEEFRVLPVVMLTSSREERDIIESYDLGINAYVVKPVDFQDFIEAVRTLGLFWAVMNEPRPQGGAHG